MNQETQERDLAFTADLVRQWPLILGKKIRPGWNVGQRYDVRVMVMESMFTFGNSTALTTVQVKDKQEEAPFDKREQLETVHLSYKYPNLRALERGDVTGVPMVSFRGEQMPVEKLLRIRK